MYVKLFSSILTSSVWSEDMPTRIVWITLLALADKDGDVRSSPSGLARLANVSHEDCQRALQKFMSPDTEDPTQENEGRRIEERQGGWFIYKYGHYRGLQDMETRKAQWREAAKTRRQKKTAESHQKSSQDHHGSSHTEAEADTETVNNTASLRFDIAEHHSAYLALRSVQRNPLGFDATIKGTISGNGCPAYDKTVVSRALFDFWSMNGAVPCSALAFRSFCRKIATEGQARPSNGRQTKEERTAAVLNAFIAKGDSNGQ